MSNISTVQFCVREELNQKDIDLKEIVVKETIVKSRRINDTKRHSNVPPKPKF